ncbi:MAG: NAD(P)H-binding protein [Actinomycetota bacterium]|nr:NAD(P)H-binding protein [Actinomycetota bacterium]
MIVITGATGQLGGRVVEQLLERVPASEIALSTRDPANARGLAARGVRVRRGDFDDGASLRHAFEGATKVLLVSSGALGEDGLRRHRTVIDAARDCGVERLVYTSQMGADPASAFPPMTTHAATEAMLAASGMAFTALRNGYYAASGLMFMGRALETGELVAPEDGPVAWTTHDDLASAAAVVLAGDGDLDGVTPPLTGREALTLADLAAIASEVTGRAIARVIVSDDEHRANLVAGGLPDRVADLLCGSFVASRRGAFAATDPTLEALVGRPPATMRQFLAAAAAG